MTLAREALLLMILASLPPIAASLRGRVPHEPVPGHDPDSGEHALGGAQAVRGGAGARHRRPVDRRAADALHHAAAARAARRWRSEPAELALQTHAMSPHVAAVALCSARLLPAVFLCPCSAAARLRRR